jgi:hypothetical protein
MPDDFYVVEDSDGGVAYGSGKIDIGGQTVSFHFQAYGAVIDINIDGTKYPQMYGAIGDWKYSFPGSYGKGGESSDERDKLVPQNIVTKIADKIEQVYRTRIEPANEIEQIASHIEPEGLLDDSDEFEEGGPEITFSHIKDGRKVQMPEGSKPSEFIKRLPTKNEAPEPPLPKGLYRDPPAKRERWGDEDPREDEPRF